MKTNKQAVAEHEVFLTVFAQIATKAINSLVRLIADERDEFDATYLESDKEFRIKGRTTSQSIKARMNEYSNNLQELALYRSFLHKMIARLQIRLDLLGAEVFAESGESLGLFKSEKHRLMDNLKDDIIEAVTPIFKSYFKPAGDTYEKGETMLTQKHEYRNPETLHVVASASDGKNKGSLENIYSKLDITPMPSENDNVMDPFDETEEMLDLTYALSDVGEEDFKDVVNTVTTLFKNDLDSYEDTLKHTVLKDIKDDEEYD